jgi:cytochrome c551/c552
MKTGKTLLPALVLALWLAVSPARAGGWAVVALEEWPEVIRAGETFTIVFSVRQHGETLAGGYDPVVRASRAGSGDRLEITALETKRTGYYTAELNLPSPGDWNWSISYHGGVEGAQTMPDLTAAAAAAAAPGAGIEPAGGLSPGTIVAAFGTLTLFAGAGFYAVTRSRAAAAAALAGLVVLAAGLLVVPRVQAAAEAPPVESSLPSAEPVSLAEQGRFLFQAKGCIVCHSHAELREGYTGVAIDIGPEFTWGTKRPVEFLRSWLKDPAAIKPDTAMPNLELSAGEIEALAAFLMGELDK